jgi:hypothetical protein
MLRYRNEYEKQGGIVGSAAAPTLDATDWAAFKVLLAAPLLLLGWVPEFLNFRKKKKK